MEKLIEDLFYQKIDVRFFTEKRLEMRYWIGAVLRNRFLYAAEQVFDANGLSLRSIIDTLTLSKDHFLFRQFNGGFPKGFLFDCSRLPHGHSGFILEADRVYTFSLIIVGDNVKLKSLFIDALKLMLESGFGTPVLPLMTIDISAGDVIRVPEVLDDSKKVLLEINLKTPVNLMRNINAAGNGFQNKLNNFPSFYQFMRSLAFRLVSLEILYTGNVKFFDKDGMNKHIDSYIEQSMYAMLLDACICYEKCYSTPKKGENNVYTFGGYTGKLIFDNVPVQYIPLLRFASGLGVGADINFGMGNFDVIVIDS